MMEATTPNGFFASYQKILGQFKLPGFDASAILESRRKDIEAIVEANTTVLAGVQSVARKQAEIVRSTLTGLQSLATRGTQSEPSAATAGEFIRQALHRSLVDAQELADTAYRAQADSIAVVTKRVAEHVEELKASLQPKKN